MSKLSENFTVLELSTTSTGIYNTPSEPVLNNLLDLCTYILQPIRDKWGVMAVTSGYRSYDVNNFVGGVSSSSHIKGRAVDFIPVEADIDTVFEWIVNESGIKYGSVILENKDSSRWIHISLLRLHKSNGLSLLYNNGKYSIYEGSRRLSI